MRFRLDVDRGPAWWGRRLNVQVLRPGGRLPVVADAVDVRVSTDDEPVITFTVPLDLDDGPWVVLRVSDPSVPADPRAAEPYRSLGSAVAYASPFFLRPPA